MRVWFLALGWLLLASSGWAGTILLSQQPQPECQVVSFATKEVVSDDCYNVPGILFSPGGLMEIRSTWGEIFALSVVSGYSIDGSNDTTDLEIVGLYNTQIVYQEDFILTGGSGLVDMTVIGATSGDPGGPSCFISLDAGSPESFPGNSSTTLTIAFGVPFSVYASAGVFRSFNGLPQSSGFGAGFGGGCSRLGGLSFAPRPEAVITGQVLVEPFDAPPPGVEDVPEPGTFLMLAAGLIGLIARKRSA